MVVKEIIKKRPISVDDTKIWILLFLYKASTTLDEMTNMGCKRMVFGHSHEQFMKILDDLYKKDMIRIGGKSYTISTAGKFEINNKVLAPLIGLETTDLTNIITKLQTTCDVTFLNELRVTSSEENRENIIKQWGLQKLHVVLYWVMKIKLEYDKLTSGSSP